MENIKVKDKLKKIYLSKFKLDKLILYTYIESTNCVDYVVYTKAELENIDLIDVKEIEPYRGGHLANYHTKKNMLKAEKATKHTIILSIYELMDL